MSQISITSHVRRLSVLAAALACAGALVACGGDSDDSSSSGTSADTTSSSGGEGLDPAAAAQSLADCTTQAGLDGTVTQPAIPNAVAVDMTTKNTTIVVEVFATADEAAGYKNEADLDQEVIDNYVIIGGTIKPAQHDIITGCING